MSNASDRVSVRLHPEIAESIGRIAREYRLKARTGLTSYERQLLRTLEEAVEQAE